MRLIEVMKAEAFRLAQHLQQGARIRYRTRDNIPHALGRFIGASAVRQRRGIGKGQT
jgi:hypothetical protein